MVTPLYGQRKTLGQNNYIPMLRKPLRGGGGDTEKGQNHSIKKRISLRCSIWKLVVLNRQLQRTEGKYRGCLQTSKEKRKVATNQSHKGKCKWAGNSQVWGITPDYANVEITMWPVSFHFQAVFFLGFNTVLPKTNVI